MNVGTAHSEVNPNTRVMNSRGIWLSYVLAIGLLHVVLLSIPFVSVPVVWTLTNLIHNMVRASATSHNSLPGAGGETPARPGWAAGWHPLASSPTHICSKDQTCRLVPVSRSGGAPALGRGPEC